MTKKSNFVLLPASGIKQKRDDWVAIAWESNVTQSDEDEKVRTPSSVGNVVDRPTGLEDKLRKLKALREQELIPADIYREKLREILQEHGY